MSYYFGAIPCFVLGVHNPPPPYLLLIFFEFGRRGCFFIVFILTLGKVTVKFSLFGKKGVRIGTGMVRDSTQRARNGEKKHYSPIFKTKFKVFWVGIISATKAYKFSLIKIKNLLRFIISTNIKENHMGTASWDLLTHYRQTDKELRFLNVFEVFFLILEKIPSHSKDKNSIEEYFYPFLLLLGPCLLEYYHYIMKIYF